MLKIYCTLKIKVYELNLRELTRPLAQVLSRPPLPHPPSPVHPHPPPHQSRFHRSRQGCLPFGSGGGSPPSTSGKALAFGSPTHAAEPRGGSRRPRPLALPPWWPRTALHADTPRTPVEPTGWQWQWQSFLLQSCLQHKHMFITWVHGWNKGGKDGWMDKCTSVIMVIKWGLHMLYCIIEICSITSNKMHVLREIHKVIVLLIYLFLYISLTNCLASGVDWASKFTFANSPTLVYLRWMFVSSI